MLNFVIYEKQVIHPIKYLSINVCTEYIFRKFLHQQRNLNFNIKILICLKSNNYAFLSSCAAHAIK